MKLPKPFMKLAVVLALLMPMLTACATSRVRPAKPICPPPIVLPKSITAPLDGYLPTWLLYQEPTLTPAPPRAPASSQCVRPGQN
jgi:hypothetical protein